MFPVEIYQRVYLLIVSISTLWLASEYGKSRFASIDRRGSRGVVISILVCAFMILFLGTRPLSGIGDTGNYTRYYEMIEGDVFVFDWNTQNLIFDHLLLWFASKKIPIVFFFVFIAAIYFIVMLMACKKLFPRHDALAYIVYLGAFSTFSYGTNGIKAGAAASIFLLALAYKDKKILCFLLASISWGFHHSMSMVIVALVCSMFFNKTKTYFYIWALCVVIAALHIGLFQSWFAGLTDETGAAYLKATKDDESTWLTGFRLDFILYSAAPVVVGYWMLFKNKVVNDGYEMWLRMYLLTNSVWMLCMYANYSNRIAYLSWFMLPVVLIYPFIGFSWNSKQAGYAKKTALYHLGFTLFMVIVYYGLKN